MDKVKPNLFKISTKELTQDSIITWLIQWSNPQVKEFSPSLHACGMALLKLLIGGADGFDSSKIVSVNAGRQWDNIDVWAEIFYENDEKTLLIIEDKTFTSEHSNQLVRYKENAQKWCIENKYSLTCAFIKIGSEPLKVIRSIEEKGFRVFDRNKILTCLNEYKNINDSLINEFVDYLQSLENDHQSFEHIAPDGWSEFSWIGLYQFIEGRIPINTWHFVNNPSGGFWNLCLTWEYWQDFPVYIQIEQGKLCYKIALNEDETGLENGKMNIDSVQDFVHQSLMKFAGEKDFQEVRRPYPFVHRGNYRTFGVVERGIWLGDGKEVLEKEKVLESIKRQILFYREFIKYMESISYEAAGLIG